MQGVAKRKRGPGGARPGAGRKPGPPESVRRNRVVVMLTDAELAGLKRRAAKDGNPMGTAAYKIVAASLARSAARRK